LKCDICRRNDIFYRRAYEGVNLCSPCFRRSVEDKVRRTISEHKMLNWNDHVAVAVSGGKDSLALLHILKRLDVKFPRSRLTAIAVDEGVKGYRDEALRIAQESCEKIHVPLRTLSFKELYGFSLDELVAERKLNFPCAVCGVLRRRAIATLAESVGAAKVATAHNLDDEVQTFLLNIFHGDPWRIARTAPALSGLGGLFLKKVKPLCKILEKEIALYAYASGIAFQNITCPYAGSALRNDLRRALDLMEERHPGAKYMASNSMETLRRNMSKPDRKDFRRCKICRSPSARELCSVCKIISRTPLQVTT